MKPKVVRDPKPLSIPSSPATRDLTTMEKATSWVDEHGMINVEEGIDRVFKAATEGGLFTVCMKSGRPGEIERLQYRSFPEAMAVCVHYMIQQRSPMLYAATSNRDALIAARAYRDEKTGKYVSKFDATADLFQRFLDMWCKEKGIKNHPRAPLLDKLRTQHRIPRERLPTKIKRERL